MAKDIYPVNTVCDDGVSEKVNVLGKRFFFFVLMQLFFSKVSITTPTKQIPGEIERDLTAVQFYPSCRDNEWKDFNAPRESKPDLSEKKFELTGI